MIGSNDKWKVQCACSQVQVEAQGEPLITLACYCEDCQTAGKQIGALPNAHSGLDSDGGTVSVLFRKDRVRITRGESLLVDHKLSPNSRTTRRIASCCNSNLMTRFAGSVPIVVLRNFASDARLRPDMCVLTRSAPDRSRILHDAPTHEGVPATLLMKVLSAKVAMTVADLRLGRNQHRDV